MDMQIGKGTSPMSSYVAFTRVKKKEDLLIFRPFDRELFNKGTKKALNCCCRSCAENRWIGQLSRPSTCRHIYARVVK